MTVDHLKTPDFDDPALEFECVMCKASVPGNRIAAIIRVAPTEPFDPVCVRCFHEVVNNAMLALDLKELQVLPFN